MEWFTLVSTAVGVLLGIGATSFNERVKWKRERTKARYEFRSKLYADYLADLSRTRDAIRLVARGTQPTEQARRDALEAAFVVANIYARRYQIRITSSHAVGDAADEVHHALRAIRNGIMHGEYHSDAYEKIEVRYRQAVALLISTMEEDIGALE